MREICARFCFERIPFTLDELDALDRYLLHLVDAKALVGSQEAWVQPFMINSERKVTGKYIPAYLDGVMAFLNNDLEGLRQAHKGEAIWEGIVAHDREEKSLGR
jgi:hypothetical protein